MSTLPNLERELLFAASRRSVASATKRTRRRRAGIACAIAVLGGGGATATAQLTGVVTVIGTPIAPVASPDPVSSLTESQAALDALRQDPGAASLPQTLQDDLDATRMAGENPRLGRKALTTSFGWTYAVVPAADGKVCLFVNGGSGGCGPATQIDDGTFSLASPCADGGPVYGGLLPNDAREPSLTLSDGDHRALTITNNVWAIQLQPDQPQPTTLTWTTGDTVKQAPIDSSLPPGINCSG